MAKPRRFDSYQEAVRRLSGRHLDAMLHAGEFLFVDELVEGVFAGGVRGTLEWGEGVFIVTAERVILGGHHSQLLEWHAVARGEPISMRRMLGHRYAAEDSVTFAVTPLPQMAARLASDDYQALVDLLAS